jgi:hypothetical protein
MTPQPQQPNPFNDLAYATGRWEIYRQDAGMGEKDYCILRTGDFFCRADNLEDAKEICAAIDKFRSRPTPASAYSASLTAIEIALRKEEIPSENVQWAIEKLNQYQENQEGHDAAIAAHTREEVLDKLIQSIKNHVKPESQDGRCVLTNCIWIIQSLIQQEAQR